MSALVAPPAKTSTGLANWPFGALQPVAAGFSGARLLPGPPVAPQVPIATSRQVPEVGRAQAPFRSPGEDHQIPPVKPPPALSFYACVALKVVRPFNLRYQLGLRSYKGRIHLRP